jgi:Conserved in the green lineage and diatoms 27
MAAGPALVGVQKHKCAVAGFFVAVGLPVSAATFAWETEPLAYLAAASIGSSIVVTVTLLRLYLGWAFVGNRLLSATVEYEGAPMQPCQTH